MQYAEQHTGAALVHFRARARDRTLLNDTHSATSKDREAHRGDAGVTGPIADALIRPEKPASLYI